MARNPEYKCSGCGREVGKLNLRSKLVEFKEIGKGGRTVRSRTIGWLCIVPQPDGGPSCLDADTHWNLPMYSTSPGMADTVLSEEITSDEDGVTLLPTSQILDLDEHLRATGMR